MWAGKQNRQMKTLPTQKILLSLFLVIAISLPLAANARETRGRGTVVKPFDQIKEATISSVTGVSITITYQREKRHEKGGQSHPGPYEEG